jgi:hypothetical protein
MLKEHHRECNHQDDPKIDGGVQINTPDLVGGRQIAVVKVRKKYEDEYYVKNLLGNETLHDSCLEKALSGAQSRHDNVGQRHEYYHIHAFLFL